MSSWNLTGTEYYYGLYFAGVVQIFFSSDFPEDVQEAWVSVVSVDKQCSKAYTDPGERGKNKCLCLSWTGQQQKTVKWGVGEGVGGHGQMYTFI